MGSEGLSLFRVATCAIACVLPGCRVRFLEERKEIMEKFAQEQDAFLRDAQEKHGRELLLLQQGHQQQLLAQRVELETKHHSELVEKLAALESKQQALLETHVAQLQGKHNAEMSAVEKRHQSNLDELESCYVANVQTLRDEHKQALERLQVELEAQLRKRDSSHREILTQELEKLKLKHTEELRSVRESLGVNPSAQHTESGKGPATDLQGAHQVRCQGHLLRLLPWPHVACVWVFVDMRLRVLVPHPNVYSCSRVSWASLCICMCTSLCWHIRGCVLVCSCVSVSVSVCASVSEPHGQLIALVIDGLAAGDMVTDRVVLGSCHICTDCVESSQELTEADPEPS